MTRYHVASPGECESVRQAINTGWRAGPAAFAERVVNGVVVAREPIGAWELRTGRPVGWLQLLPVERLIVSGADAALELPDAVAQHVDEQLGRGVIPRANQLVAVTRAREHSLLPAAVRDVLDDRYVASVLTSEAEDTPQARAVITAELQNGSRAANALARKDSRAGAQAIERALGLGAGK
jgi:hypothetical protein